MFMRIQGSKCETKKNNDSKKKINGLTRETSLYIQPKTNKMKNKFIHKIHLRDTLYVNSGVYVCGEHMHNSQRTVNNSFQTKAAQNQSCPKFLEIYLFVCIISFLKICAYAESCLSIKITLVNQQFFFWFFRFCSHIFYIFFFPPSVCVDSFFV